jgi:signal transduction histidine kinase
VIRFELAALESETARNRAMIHGLKHLAETIGREIHALALALRPTALDDLGLARAMANFVEEWAARARVEVDFHTRGLDGTGRLPRHLETTLYRIICEGFNNVLKHAEARHVSLIIERRDDQAIAILEDDGNGFDLDAVRKKAGHRLGMTGMVERAALVGGEMKVESAPGGGTTIFVRIPLPHRGQAS